MGLPLFIIRYLSGKTFTQQARYFLIVRKSISLVIDNTKFYSPLHDKKIPQSTVRLRDRIIISLTLIVPRVFLFL